VNNAIFYKCAISNKMQLLVNVSSAVTEVRLITTKLLDFVRRPDFYKPENKRFGNWICFRNVCFLVCRNPDDGQSPEA
jgi:hypothetical protein